MKNQLIKIMANVFGVPESDINDLSSPDNIVEWDSLKHMQLIIEIESAFKIEFSVEAILQSRNFELLLLYIHESQSNIEQ
jgi:acyl carrier protein